jgi:CubicO group peptidase (beta-lactamase class C family)
MGAEPEYYNAPFLMSEPGSRFQYGISTDVLGQLVTPVSGLPLAEFFAQRIFAPLGMRETAFAVPQDAARLATLHAAGAGGFNELPNELAGEPPRGGGGLYATVGDFVELLRLFLNAGEVGGVRLLAAETVQAITRNQIAALTAERQTSVVPERTGDFLFMDGSQKFGLGVLLETRDRAGGRPAGSYSWGGIFNTYFWVDPDAQLAAALFMQMSPFSAPACMDVYREFEQAVYGELRPRR